MTTLFRKREITLHALTAWQQRVMDFEFIFAARKSLWHRLCSWLKLVS